MNKTESGREEWNRMKQEQTEIESFSQSDCTVFLKNFDLWEERWGGGLVSPLLSAIPIFRLEMFQEQESTTEEEEEESQFLLIFSSLSLLFVLFPRVLVLLFSCSSFMFSFSFRFLLIPWFYSSLDLRRLADIWGEAEEAEQKSIVAKAYTKDFALDRLSEEEKEQKCGELGKEHDDGNVEYKLKLVGLSEDRIQHLVCLLVFFMNLCILAPFVSHFFFSLVDDPNEISFIRRRRWGSLWTRSWR